MPADADPVGPDVLLDVRDLAVEYPALRGRGRRLVLNGIDLQVRTGETVGLIGESGSGKTTLGRAILGLVTPSRGAIVFDGEDITSASHRRRRALSAELQAVFQDPYSSLNPARTVLQSLAEPVAVHRRLRRADAERDVTLMLRRVGMPPEAAHRYPREFSGGQRQRIAIARALMVSPRLVICDEPLSALDLSVQAQILNLLAELQAESGVSYLLISHDLAVVRHLAHRVAVLHDGRIAESGSTAEVIAAPSHPYTRELIEAAPRPDPAQQRARRRAQLATASASPPASPATPGPDATAPAEAGHQGPQSHPSDSVYRLAPSGHRPVTHSRVSRSARMKGNQQR
jgi:ABC-type glutathione transport system ATPase component